MEIKIKELHAIRIRIYFMSYLTFHSKQRLTWLLLQGQSRPLCSKHHLSVDRALKKPHNSSVCIHTFDTYLYS